MTWHARVHARSVAGAPCAAPLNCALPPVLTAPSLTPSHPHHCRQILPRREGLVRLSDWDTAFTKSVANNFKQGDLVDVQVSEIGQDGRIRLSRRAVLLADSASGTTSGEGEAGSA